MQRNGRFVYDSRRNVTVLKVAWQFGCGVTKFNGVLPFCLT